MKILYATDGEAPAKAAGTVLAKVFDPEKVSIDVLTVSPPPAYDLWANDEEIPWEALALPIPSAHVLALEAAEHLEEQGFVAEPRTAVGSAAREILQLAEDESHDLVVLGGGHTTWLGNILLGSVSRHVLDHAPCSVLIAHHPVTGDRNLLVAADGSESASYGVELIAEVCDTTCPVHVATVVPPEYTPLVIGQYGMAYPAEVEAQSTVRREVVDRGRRVVSEAADLLRSKGFATATQVLQGSVGVQLLKEAENITADLVIVGSKGRSPLGRALLGSVTDRIVRHAAATLVARKPPR